jgi:hypothetical protein
MRFLLTLRMFIAIYIGRRGCSVVYIEERRICCMYREEEVLLYVQRR